jgi:tRNA (guanine37-N1)-methyltransferase
MRIDIISAVPELLESPLNHSIMKRAQQKGLVEIYVHNLRAYGFGKHKQIDDYAYGGGAGMVMMIEPIFTCLESIKKQGPCDEIIYFTPDGETYDQSLANRFSLNDHLVLLCGHYKGVDHRVRENLITREISVGDYVLSGGEIPAAIIVDSVVRLLPGVLNDETSALFDSFQDNLLSPPVYTRPEEFRGWKVPDVLLSGHFGKIEEWRSQKAEERTKRLRPDLLEEE